MVKFSFRFCIFVFVFDSILFYIKGTIAIVCRARVIANDWRFDWSFEFNKRYFVFLKFEIAFDFVNNEKFRISNRIERQIDRWCNWWHSSKKKKKWWIIVIVKFTFKLPLCLFFVYLVLCCIERRKRWRSTWIWLCDGFGNNMLLSLILVNFDIFLQKIVE